MVAVNIVVMLLIILDTTVYWIALASKNNAKKKTMLLLETYLFETLLWVFLAVWSCALFKLYRDVNSSKRLLPDKKIFIFHGVLLTAFLILYLVDTIVLQIAYSKPKDSNAQLTLFGVNDLLIMTQQTIEMITFYLVVFLMMPLTKKSKQRFAALQKFLLNGFIKPEELEAAVLAQNPDMDEETRNQVRHDCQWMGNVLAQSGHSIMSGMTSV